jgi:hypothetical protein
LGRHPPESGRPRNRRLGFDPSFATGARGLRDCLWYDDTASVVAQTKRNLKPMPKRGSDADSRVFFDQLASLTALRLKAKGEIRLEDKHGVIAFGDKEHGVKRKCIDVTHTKFHNCGAWSCFLCPRCGGRKKKLWLIDDAPRCLSCSWSLGRAVSLGLRLRPDRASERARPPRRQAAGHARRRPDAPQTCAAKLGQPTPRQTQPPYMGASPSPYLHSPRPRPCGRI